MYVCVYVYVGWMQGWLQQSCHGSEKLSILIIFLLNCHHHKTNCFAWLGGIVCAVMCFSHFHKKSKRRENFGKMEELNGCQLCWLALSWLVSLSLWLIQSSRSQPRFQMLHDKATNIEALSTFCKSHCHPPHREYLVCHSLRSLPLKPMTTLSVQKKRVH